MVVNAPKHDYSREDVRRMLNVSEQQLRGWERQGLIPASPAFTFTDLIALRTLQKLRENHVSPKTIGRAMDSLKQKLSHVERPLSELKISSDGKTIAVQVAGQKMEAISGQLLFDFETAELRSIRSFPEKTSLAPEIRTREAEEYFQHGLHLEETGAPVEVAIEAYRRAIDLNPHAAGALVNLGTIYYRQRKFAEAEDHYRRAVQADPRYPLAHFNLGNLHDERGEFDAAREHYIAALRWNPHYADAHFNLALLCEQSGDPRKALSHWQAYLKLDASSSWAKIARRQLDRLKHGALPQLGPRLAPSH
ncbi:MAG: tetratricopeptide repeat protein [Acidobacteriota bacterium]|nr:tetratricopeptide repeat protein [Acidobacteriota bacterium]